eukprot:9501495-Alexandrium_andersonii.AAC.1
MPVSVPCESARDWSACVCTVSICEAARVLFELSCLPHAGAQERVPGQWRPNNAKTTTSTTVTIGQ